MSLVYVGERETVFVTVREKVTSDVGESVADSSGLLEPEAVEVNVVEP